MRELVRLFCEENKFLKKTKNWDYMAIAKKRKQKVSFLWWQDNQVCVWLKLWFQICFNLINWWYFWKGQLPSVPIYSCLFTLACLCRALCTCGKTAEGPKSSFWLSYFSVEWIPRSILWPEEHQHQPRGGGERENQAACFGKCRFSWLEVTVQSQLEANLRCPFHSWSLFSSQRPPEKIKG